MATATAYLTPDYQNTISVTGNSGTLAANTTTGVIVFGKRRILHIAALNTTASGQVNRCVMNYTLGNSVTGAVAPAPVATSPFFTGDEGFTIDLGDSYDSIQLGNFTALNGSGSQVSYSISLMCKY